MSIHIFPDGEVKHELPSSEEMLNQQDVFPGQRKKICRVKQLLHQSIVVSCVCLTF